MAIAAVGLPTADFPNQEWGSGAEMNNKGRYEQRF